MATKEKQKYRVLTGMDYPPDRRVEPGEIVDDIPAMSLGWLLEQGHIERVTGPVVETTPLGAAAATYVEAADGGTSDGSTGL